MFSELDQPRNIFSLDNRQLSALEECDASIELDLEELRQRIRSAPSVNNNQQEEEKVSLSEYQTFESNQENGFPLAPEQLTRSHDVSN
jgi:hypothetical protein